MSTRSLVLFVAGILGILATGAPNAAAQAGNPAQTAKPVSALMVDVVISRHLGEKRLSSTPYSLAVTPDNRSSLRMGGQVPIPSTTFTPVTKDDAKPAAPMVSYSYRDIGTNIDVQASGLTDGRSRLTLTIDETSVYPEENAPPTTKTTGAPAFRGFKSTNSVMLRDGQSIEYTMATDRLTGEVFRVSVKMTVVY